jgi:two-component system nitrogen regulation sensor histidine kinase NtrY
VTSLEPRVPITVSGTDTGIAADPDQLEQLLINLVKNAADTGAPAHISWRVAGDRLELDVVDEGPGLSGSTNLFVPFFTTKANGTGIGLVLSRQIAEAHGGSLTLENRVDAPGCIARLTVPIGSST